MTPPLPNTEINHYGEQLRVVASVVFRDDLATREEWTVLMLRKHAPYFMVGTIVPEPGGWRVFSIEAPIDNIVPAVEKYKEWGGDY